MLVACRCSGAIVRLTGATTRLYSTSTFNIPSHDDVHSIPSIGLTHEDSISTPLPSAKPFPCRPLPLSPLMDPSFIAARSKHHQPKPVPSKTKTAFQAQLMKNPYALALASPVRLCCMTGVYLPKYFLQSFELMADPEAREGGAWWMPRSLTDKPRKEKSAGLDIKVRDVSGVKGLGDGAAEAVNGQVNTSTAEMVKVATETPEIEGDETPAVDVPYEGQSQVHRGESSTKSIGPKAYILSRRDLLQAIQTPKSGYDRSPHHKFGSNRMRQYKKANHVLETSQWRVDMEFLIAELMRRRSCELLTEVTKRKRGYVVGCSDWDDALRKGQVGVILWTGGKNIEETGKIPPEFATLYLGQEKQKKIPVYNLRRLFGNEKLEELRSHFPSKIFENEILVVKNKRATVELQLRLWGLQGYLAEHKMDEEVASL